MPRQTPHLPDDALYRAILIVLVASLLVGAVLAIAGDLVWHSPGLSQAGTWLVVASGGAYVFFRILGTREARKRSRGTEQTPPSDNGSGTGGSGTGGGDEP